MVLHIIKGIPSINEGDLTTKTGKIIKCLKDTEKYRFLGVPESEKHDTKGLITNIARKVKQRSHILWSSPLYDVNKVEATNTFVNSLITYMWSERFNLEDLRKIDREIRKTLNICGAKHPTQLNELLYIARTKGGRGLRCIEDTYKETKIKSSIKLVINWDPHIKIVKQFHLQCQEKHRSSIFTEAIRYGKE